MLAKITTLQLSSVNQEFVGSLSLWRGAGVRASGRNPKYFFLLFIGADRKKDGGVFFSCYSLSPHPNPYPKGRGRQNLGTQILKRLLTGSCRSWHYCALRRPRISKIFLIRPAPFLLKKINPTRPRSN